MSLINLYGIELDLVLGLRNHLIHKWLVKKKTFNKNGHVLWFCPMELLRTSFFTLWLTALRGSCLFTCAHPLQKVSSQRVMHMCVMSTICAASLCLPLSASFICSFIYVFLYPATQSTKPENIWGQCTFLLSLLLTQLLGTCVLDNANRAILGWQSQNMGTERAIPSIVLNPNFYSCNADTNLKYINS